MQCQSSHKYFEIIHKIFIFQLKLPSFLDQTPTFQFWLPIFSRNGFCNFCFQKPSENSDSDQLHCYYMHVDDLSLLKRLSHDVVQFLNWDTRFQVLSSYIFELGFIISLLQIYFFYP